MSNGLSLSLNEFNKLPMKDKFSCLYENQVRTLELIRGYRFHQKMIYAMGTVILALGGYLLQLHLK